MCRQGSVERVLKKVLLHVVHGKHTAEGPEKSWENILDVLYELQLCGMMVQ